MTKRSCPDFPDLAAVGEGWLLSDSPAVQILPVPPLAGESDNVGNTFYALVLGCRW